MHKVGVIYKREFGNLDAQNLTDRRKLLLESAEPIPNLLTTGYTSPLRFCPKPVSNLQYRVLWLVVMGVYILTGDVRNKPLIPVRLSIQNQIALCPVNLPTKSLASKEDS